MGDFEATMNAIPVLKRDKVRRLLRPGVDY